MTSEERAKRVHNYFAKPPKQPVKDYVKAIIGLLIIIVGIHVTFLVIVGLLVLAWGGVGIARYAAKVSALRPKATDAEMDAWLKAAIAPTVLNGAKRLNVHPTEVSGSMEDSQLEFIGVSNEPNVQVKRGDDGKLRFSHYEILVVFLSNWRMPVYKVNYDMANDVAAHENTMEYNLDKVDGIVTANDRINVLAKNGSGSKDDKKAGESNGILGHVTTAQLLCLMVSGTRAVTLITGVTGKESVKVENVDDPSEIDVGISKLREHLRARHQGAQPAAAGLPGGAAPPNFGPSGGLGLDLPPQAPRPDPLGPGPDLSTPGPAR